MAFTKILNSDLNDKGVIGLADTPQLSTTAMQEKFEETARGVIIPKHNQLIDELEDSTGASSIGSTDGTVQGDITSTKNRMTTAEGKITTLEGDSHTHTNKTVIDKFTEESGNLKYDGYPLGVAGVIPIDNNSIKENGDGELIGTVFHATCNTDFNVATKVVNLPGYTPTSGDTIYVDFTTIDSSLLIPAQPLNISINDSMVANRIYSSIDSSSVYRVPIYSTDFRFRGGNTIAFTFDGYGWVLTEDVSDAVAPQWRNTFTYNKGDVRLSGKDLYVSKTDNNTGNIPQADVLNWEQTNIINLLDKLSKKYVPMSAPATTCAANAETTISFTFATSYTNEPIIDISLNMLHPQGISYGYMLTQNASGAYTGCDVIIYNGSSGARSPGVKIVILSQD